MDYRVTEAQFLEMVEDINTKIMGTNYDAKKYI